MHNKIKEILIAHGFEIKKDDFEESSICDKYMDGIIKKGCKELEARLQLTNSYNIYITFSNYKTNWEENKTGFILTENDLPKVIEVIEEFLKKFGEEK